MSFCESRNDFVAREFVTSCELVASPWGVQSGFFEMLCFGVNLVKKRDFGPKMCYFVPILGLLGLKRYF